MTKDLDVSLRGIQQAKQQLDGRGFAGTVRPEQAKNLAATDFEIDAVHRARLRAVPKILEDLGQAADGNDDFIGFTIFDIRFKI